MSLPNIIKVTKKHFIFECGCFVEHNNDFIPQIDFDNLNKSCDCVWEVLSQGKTRGIFQLENGSLGVHWSKEMKCKSIDDVSVLIALVRPGVLESRTESGESTAKAIIKRRNRECEIEYMHPSLEPILGETYGEIIFQESAIRLAQDIAGFNPNDAETLRKSIGKKDTSLMAGLKDKFINGCINTKIVDETIARKLFENIEKSQRYSFNKCLSQTSSIIFTDGTSETVEALFNSGAWKGKKTYSLKFWERVKAKCPNDNLLKNSEVIENEIEDIQYAGEQYVYRVTLKRRKIADNEHYGKPNRPNFSITVTGSHKHPTRCRGEVRTDELIVNEDSLYCYDPMQAYRPKYRHAASKIIKIERLDKERVYDVTMKVPYHNFLADGVFTCNSHSVGYGTQTYITVWTKTHFPLEFYTSNLRLNEERGGKKEKLLEEKSNMIKEAASFGINILPPSMSFPCAEFTIKDEHTIYYGISNIKMTGDKEAETTLNWLKDREGEEIKWLDVLFGLGETLKSASFENLCLAGFFNLPITRQGMVYEYKTYRKLTAKEVEWIRTRKHYLKDLKDCLIDLVESFKRGQKGGISRKDRVPKIEDLIKTLENPPHSLEDTPITINRNEKELLGVALTYSDIEARTLCGIEANTTCKELNEGKTGKELTIVVSLTKVKEHKAKNGKFMAFCSGQDDQDVVESIVVFPNVYEEYSNLIFEKNTVILAGCSGDKKSFIVNKVTQI